MQIVIDIPNSIYANLSKIANGSIASKRILDCVKNGIPLPKGHGRLIDVNDLLDRIGLEDNDRNREDNVGEIVTLEDFDFAPTIIEADESEVEE